MADGLVSVAASAMSSLPLTTFAQNNGVIQMTGGFPPCRENHCGYPGDPGAVSVIGWFFTTIPAPVLGGAMTLMFSMIAIAGSVLFCPTVCAAAKP